MPGTVTTNESFPKGTTKTQIKEEQRLRIKAGAISCDYSGSASKGWTLTTVWNVIGEQ